MKSDLIQYYAKRATEYESIYQKPERQEDLKRLSSVLKDCFKNKTVLEVACGTGYWTQIISETAKSIFSTDINQKVIEIAKSRQYNSAVDFEVADIYNFKPMSGLFNAGFGGFIWSHIPKQKLKSFLKTFVKNISPDGIIVFIDNLYVPESSTPIDSSDSFGNTYQLRKLADGSMYKIMKNFPEASEFKAFVEPYDKDFELIRLEYFWILKFVSF